MKKTAPHLGLHPEIELRYYYLEGHNDLLQSLSWLVFWMGVLMNRYVPWFAAALLTVLLPVSTATTVHAQGADGSSGVESSGAELAPGTSARYRVGYINSQIGGTPRSATIVTVVNEATVPCTISVDWRKGFSATGIGGVICTTTFAGLARGQSAEFCSRSVPGTVSVCNSTCAPELTFDEGNAVVGSTTGAACGKITVSARTYYFNGSDTSIAGITDPSVTKFGLGSVGD